MRARCPSEDEETLVYDKSGGVSSSRNVVAAGVLFEELVRQLAMPMPMPMLRDARPPLPAPRILHVHPTAAEPPPLPGTSGRRPPPPPLFSRGKASPPPLPVAHGATGSPPRARSSARPPPLPASRAAETPSPLARVMAEHAAASRPQPLRCALVTPPVLMPPPLSLSAADEALQAALRAADESAPAPRAPRRAARRFKVPSLVFVMSVGLGFGLGIDQGTRAAITTHIEAAAHAALVVVQP